MKVSAFLILFHLVLIFNSLSLAQPAKPSRMQTVGVPGTGITVSIVETKAPTPSPRTSQNFPNSSAISNSYPTSAPPIPEAPEAVNLTVTKGPGSTLNLNYNGGTAPYVISYSPDPSFQGRIPYVLPQTLAANYGGTSFTASQNPSQNLECFVITDASTVSTAVQGIGYDPYPSPDPPQITGGDAWWGTIPLPPGSPSDASVTVNSNYLDPIASENSLFFNFFPVKAASVTGVSGGFATQATFRIPDDARSSFLILQSHGQTSAVGYGQYQRMVPRNIGLPYPAASIRGVVFNPNDPKGEIFVAHGSVISLVDVFLHTPVTINVPDALTKPYISRVTSTGVLPYIDGINGAPAIRKITCNNGSCGSPSNYALTVDAGFTRAIRPVGIDCTPDGSACYVADAITGRLVRIPANNSGPITDNYGNHTWSFPDPSAIAADPAVNGYVLVADSFPAPYPYVWFILSAGFSYAYAQVGTIWHHMEADRDLTTASAIRVQGGSDPGSAEAFNWHQIGPSAGGPVRNLGARIYGTADGVLDVAPDDVFGVPEYPPQQVIINNSGQGFAYPSTEQVSDRLIKITINWWNSASVQLELMNPPDFAGYGTVDPTDQNTWPANYPYETSDNKSPDNDYGITLNSNGSNPINGPPWLQATAGANFQIVFYLKVPKRYSGNQFQIRVVKKTAAGAVMNNKVLYLTGVYTSWKRVFVERDNMFRKGGLLWRNSTANTSQVDVYSWSQVSNLDWIVVFDRLHPYESGGELAQVLNVSNPPNPDGSLTLTLDTPLKNAYLASGPAVSGQPPDFVNGESGGFGVVSNCDFSPNQINTGSCFFDPDMRNIEQPFDDGFVQFLAPRSGMNAVPFLDASFFGGFQMAAGGTCALPATEPVPLYDFTPFWRFGWIWYSHHDQPNYIWLGGAGEVSQLSDQSGPCTLCNLNRPLPEYLGISLSRHTTSFTHRGAVEDYCNQSVSQWSRQSQQDANHELAHDLYVNASFASGHDSRCDWASAGNLACADPDPACNGPQDGCLMNPQANKFDFDHRLDRFDLVCGDPGCATAPAGTSGCCTAGSPGCQVPGDGSIRHLTDPIQGVTP